MENNKIIISISGAAETGHCGPDVLKLAKEIGREIARQGCVLATGATSGFPYFSAQGYKEEKGIFSLGFSPAVDETEHKNLYFLPTDFSDVIVYTGFGFPLRDIILVKSSNAVILGCGRIGTIHEFTVAFENNIPVGILEGSWTTDAVIKTIIRNSNRVNDNIIFDSNPKRLLEKIIEMVKLKKERKEIGDISATEEIKAKI